MRPTAEKKVSDSGQPGPGTKKTTAKSHHLVEEVIRSRSFPQQDKNGKTAGKKVFKSCHDTTAHTKTKKVGGETSQQEDSKEQATLVHTWKLNSPCVSFG